MFHAFILYWFQGRREQKRLAAPAVSLIDDVVSAVDGVGDAVSAVSGDPTNDTENAV